MNNYYSVVSDCISEKSRNERNEVYFKSEQKTSINDSIDVNESSQRNLLSSHTTIIINVLQMIFCLILSSSSIRCNRQTFQKSYIYYNNNYNDPQMWVGGKSLL